MRGSWIPWSVLVVAFVLRNHVWGVDPLVTGYAGSWSNVSGPATFYLSGPENHAAELSIYDVAGRVAGTIQAAIKPQQIPGMDAKPWIYGAGFDPTTIVLPDLPSGMYHLDGPKLAPSRVSFIMKQPERQADIVVVYPTNTVNAYTKTNGMNLYSRDENGKHPPAVSFHRPQNVGNKRLYLTSGLDHLLLNSDYSYKYIADSDLESYDAIAGAKLVIIPGHSEYWTVDARRNFDRFVELGGSALAMTGNAMFRSVEYDDTGAPTQLMFSPRRQFTSAALEYPTWESIGVDFNHGGNGSGFKTSRAHIKQPYDGWKLLDVSPSYFKGTGLEVGDVIDNLSPEYDGVPFTETDPVTGPVVNQELLGFHEMDLIAFDNATYGNVRDTAGAWIDFRKTEDSGRIITVGSMAWTFFAGKDAHLQSKITRNMIDLMLIDQADFDGNEMLDATDIDALYAAVHASSARSRFDLTEDDIVDLDDVERWLQGFAQTTFGDVDLDGVVDFTDLLRLKDQFNQPDRGWGGADFDGDGWTDFEDFVLLASNVTPETSSRVVSVPEPTASLFALLMCTLGVRGRIECSPRARRHSIA